MIIVTTPQESLGMMNRLILNPIDPERVNNQILCYVTMRELLRYVQYCGVKWVLLILIM